MARRWWSIQHAFLNRMGQIERETNLRSRIYIRWLDAYHICHGRQFISELTELNDKEKTILTKKIPDNYEFRGIQPFLNVLIKINIILWVLLFLINNNLLHSNMQIIIVFVIICIFLFLKEWNEP
jgi:hypothetical protein